MSQIDAGVKTPSASRALARVLVVTPFESAEWRWLADYFPQDRFTWQFMNGNLFGRKQPLWAWHGWKAAARANHADIVVSHHPYMTLWVAAALWVRRIRVPHISFSFNHGNKRFFTGPLLALAHRALPKTALFNVLSTGERQLLSRLYGIPLQKLRFSPWAVRPPRATGPLPDEYRRLQPYICALGRNNRDFQTLIEATESLNVNVVIVCSKRDAGTLPVRHNVIIKTDISLDESMHVLQGSLFSVVPLIDNATGAGHMTFVHAMQLGKAQVATDVENTRDYFVHGVHGLRVPARDTEAMRVSLKRLLDDPELRESYGSAARAFADRWFSEEAAARSAKEVFDDWAQHRPWRVEPEGWSDCFNALTGSCQARSAS
jgi:glycosyltransferase involved in cell wall biosynthesis